MERPKKRKSINRRELVSRHNIFCNDIKKVIPIGNGEFCFSCDITGLQTFAGNTMAHNAWHSFPLPDDIKEGDIPETGCFMDGRLIGNGIDLVPPEKQKAADYMFKNPHIFNLGRIRIIRKNGKEYTINDIKNVKRHYDLWNGILTSSFDLCDTPVDITVCVHPAENAVAVCVKSKLLRYGIISLSIDFPYPNLSQNTPWLGDFQSESKHFSEIKTDAKKKSCIIERKIDKSNYSCEITWNKGHVKRKSSHCVILSGHYKYKLEAVYRFSFDKEKASAAYSENEPLKFKKIKQDCSLHWNKFWRAGGAIDLSESTDTRWFELERRIVLSQYLLAVQSAGSFPSAEAGLMNIDSWNGQFHMEMTWWHIAHYALWKRWHLAEKQLSCYRKFLPTAKKLAAQLGYQGAKWGKMVGPEGRTAPWRGNLALLWKQPHPIFFAELEYALKSNKKTLRKWADIIEETAIHMADYFVEHRDGFYHLDPVMPPSEIGFTYDTVFDLAYWRWGLQTAQTWRERMGLLRVAFWDRIIEKMAPLPIKDGVYIRSPEWTETYTTQNYEHPDMVGVFGMIPKTDGVDEEISKATLKKVWQTWQKDRIWGWDFPWIAMNATRCGEPEIAIEAMLSVDIDEIGASGMGSYPYLPANGGILFAAAMMAAEKGDNAAEEDISDTKAFGTQTFGFPTDGGWTVKAERLLFW